MAEQTTPEPGVEQAAELSVEDRLAHHFKQNTAREQHRAMPKTPVDAEVVPTETEQAAEDQAAEVPEQASDQPADDLPDTEPQSEPETWRIVHNGQEVELTREDVIRHAQQGFDYDRKTQALAEERRATQEALQAAQRLQQAAPVLMSELAQVRALESQLQQWEKVDWVQLATDQPLDYPKYRAQYDQLERSYRVARGQFEQKQNQFAQHQTMVTAQLTQSEFAKLPQYDPDFGKPDAFKAIVPEIRNYLVKRGVPEALIDDIRMASLVAVAYDGLRYQKHVANKSVATKQVRTAPPMAKPAAAQSPKTAVTRDYQQQRAQLKKSGSVEDAARLLAGLGAGKR